MYRLLKLPLEDPRRVERELAHLAAGLSPEAAGRLDLLLAASPAPEQGLHYFTLLRERQPAAFRQFAASEAAIAYLAGVFTFSRFLSEEVVEHPGWAVPLLDPEGLERVFVPEDLRKRLERSLPPGVPDPVDLARFRRMQILRIVVRDIFGLGTVAQIAAELTTLADVILEVAYARIHQALAARYGVPRANGAEAHFSVIALGKMGAEELNYSSDIDLMYLYSANGETDGPEPISNQEFFKRAANQLTKLLSSYSAAGACYRVDLRLRPDGTLGEVCISLEGAKHYYTHRARDWELQMLIKARVAAGDRATGEELLRFLTPRIYSTTLDFSAIEALSVTRERLNEKLAGRDPRSRMHDGAVDIKLARGGIRDIEFLVQCLQRLQPGTEPWLQHRSTLLALARLHDKGVLTGDDIGRLSSAYQFLRHLEHRLQFDEDRQTHLLPEDPDQLKVIARRMPGGLSAESLRAELEQHFANVAAIYERVIHLSPVEDGGGAPADGVQSASVLQTLASRAPALAAAFQSAGLRRGHGAFEHFLEQLSYDAGHLALLNDDPALSHCVLDVFENAPSVAEELVRRPENVALLARPSAEMLPGQRPPSGASALRLWYRRGVLRVEAESICRRQPVFDTLIAHSGLAEAVIANVYQIAVDEVAGAGHRRQASYRPSGQMWVLALGRLGLREFDIGSDADLTFVLADSDADELEYWTRVAERIVQLIGAYTGEGMLFAVDTRLRPNGRAGALVQTESAVIDYFATSAEAWESITYLKARAVAGDLDRADTFLQRLQHVYWTRYGAAGNTRAELREMRARVEREQGPAHPLKAGRGGYYDIDFLLLYLRLKNAGVYYQVLNTPDRIEVLEAMKALSHEHAGLLRRAATFYRALDHGLRVISGHAEGRLPKSESQRETLEVLLPRWTPVSLDELPAIQDQVRALFDRFFK